MNGLWSESQKKMQRVTREWNLLRIAYFDPRFPVEEVLQRLSVSSHPDASLLHTFLADLPVRGWRLAQSMRSNENPIIQLYGMWHRLRDTSNRLPNVPVLEHSLSYLLRAHSSKELQHVIDAFDEPYAYMTMWFRMMRSDLCGAIALGEPVAMRYELCNKKGLPLQHRLALYKTYLDCDDTGDARANIQLTFSPHTKEPLKQSEELRFYTGLLFVYAKEIPVGHLQRSCVAVYRAHVKTHRAVVRTVYWCLRRRLRVCKDVAIVIAKQVWGWKEEYLYPPRRSERNKKLKT